MQHQEKDLQLEYQRKSFAKPLTDFQPALQVVTVMRQHQAANQQAQQEHLYFFPIWLQ
jgi:hypothetical protein